MIKQLLLSIASQLQPYLFEICLAQTVTLLVLCSHRIDRSFRKFLKPHHFLIRVTGFILLNAAGYGFASFAGGKILTDLYLQIEITLRYPIILSVFMLIGLIAERMKRC